MFESSLDGDSTMSNSLNIQDALTWEVAGVFTSTCALLKFFQFIAPGKSIYLKYLRVQLISSSATTVRYHTSLKWHAH